MRILLYCKNLDGNDRAVQVALEQAKAFDAKVLMVSCVSEKPGVPKEVLDENAAKAKAKMRKYVQEYFKPAGIDCDFEVLTTNASVGEEVVRCAARFSTDSLIMPIQKRSKIGKMVFGSDSQYIILEASCTVITVK